MAALVPVAAETVAADPVAVDGRMFAPPETPLVLTRTVWKTLGDGKQIVVSRRYAVQFSRQETGFRLDGRLLDTAVEAPEQLAAMAAIERNQADQGPFPLRLDRAGLIRSTSSAAVDMQSRDASAAEGQAILSRTRLTSAEKGEAAAFLRQMAAIGANAAWPVDMFNPESIEQHQSRVIALPDGSEGQVEVALRVDGYHASGLPKAVERTVTTVLSGTSRVSREMWTLAPIEGP